MTEHDRCECENCRRKRREQEDDGASDVTTVRKMLNRRKGTGFGKNIIVPDTSE